MPPKPLAVLPKALFKTFLSECATLYTFGNIPGRIVAPLQARCNFRYFKAPYPSVSNFGWSLLCGPIASLGAIVVPMVTATLFIIPAIGELILSIKSMITALVKLIQGKKTEAFAHFRDGLVRLVLAPCLALLCVVAIPIELARFFTRCISTLIHAVKSCFKPEVQPAPEEIPASEIPTIVVGTPVAS